MAIDISYLNAYGYAIDQAGLKDNIRLVLNNAAQKTINTPEEVIEQNVASTNSALLSEYTQSIAKSNVAQQLVLDANLKETLKETLQSAYHTNLTQMQLENAKNKILSEYATKNQNNAFKYMYGFQGYTKEDIKQVSLDEVKKLYEEIITNSATICSASLPKDVDDSTIKQIKTIIEQQIPFQKPFDKDHHLFE